MWCASLPEDPTPILFNTLPYVGEARLTSITARKSSPPPGVAGRAHRYMTFSGWLSALMYGEMQVSAALSSRGTAAAEAKATATATASFVGWNRTQESPLVC